MNITKSALEVKVTTQNKQKRDYYISKLCAMDDLGLTIIKI